MAECTRGVEVRRSWSETQMVCSFGGQHFPGTPDGMFEDWEGQLTCVQVVRVPLVRAMDAGSIKDTLSQTVLTKVVKSQRWLRATNMVPSDFVIFCWLPFPVANETAEQAYDLMLRVQKLDPRFSLRLRVPAEPGALFPALFACVNKRSEASTYKSVFESDVSTYSGESSSDDEEEAITWDITWAWDQNMDCSDADGGDEKSNATSQERYTGSEQDDDEDHACEWDITWSWEFDFDHSLDQHRLELQTETGLEKVQPEDVQDDVNDGQLSERVVEITNMRSRTKFLFDDGG